MQEGNWGWRGIESRGRLADAGKERERAREGEREGEREREIEGGEWEREK